MQNTLLITGSYTQPLKLGTGQIVEGEGEGVTVWRMGEGGTPEKLFSAGKPNPTYLALDKQKRFLYTVNELKEYRGIPSASVSSYALDAESGALEKLSEQPTFGEDACNLSISPDGRHLLVANYSGGSLCVFPLQDGRIGRASCFFQHYGHGAEPSRQSEPHVHQVISDQAGRFVLVPDLGCDRIALYKPDWESGHLSPLSSIEIEAGLGPRLCVWNERGDRFYLITEMGSRVLVYSYDQAKGTGKCLQSISTLPDSFKGESIAACVKLHSAGFLYASNRGHDSIAAFRVQKDGLLSPLFIKPTQGRTPRDFAISPDGRYLALGNQESSELVIYEIDLSSGVLSERSRVFCGSPTAVLFADYDN